MYLQNIRSYNFAVKFIIYGEVAIFYYTIWIKRYYQTRNGDDYSLVWIWPLVFLYQFLYWFVSRERIWPVCLNFVCTSSSKASLWGGITSSTSSFFLWSSRIRILKCMDVSTKSVSTKSVNCSIIILFSLTTSCVIGSLSYPFTYRFLLWIFLRKGENINNIFVVHISVWGMVLICYLIS